jgi:Na+-translocating ferredoxin:NAD+ oxidoreductase RNF subunit RnfB
MREWTHSFKIDPDKCTGRLGCMRACPTQAIRVKEGKARLLSELCIDCGACLRVCPSGAITATTQSLKDLSKFQYKVAVPSAVLFGQFPASITPAHIIEGLKSLGFDEVWIIGIETALTNQAIREYMGKWKGKFPLISSSCPVVVRLIQVSYPAMVERLVHVEPPRELAGREIKRKYSEDLGIPRDEIGAIYVTSCQAKTISILEPAEGMRSDLDGTVSISDVYNGILSAAHASKETGPKTSLQNYMFSEDMFQWSTGKGQRRNLRDYRYMALTGLSNIIKVFDDIEKGKLRNIDFLECYACWGGCVNGNLTVDNFYVTRSKLARLMGELPDSKALIEAEARERYPRENLYVKAPIRPRPIKGDMGDLKERIKRLKEAEAVLSTLPGLDCGLCGAPNCKTLAKDIASGDAQQTECIFFSKDRVERLRCIYL